MYEFYIFLSLLYVSVFSQSEKKADLYEAEISIGLFDTHENEYFNLEQSSIEYKDSLRSEDADFLQVDYALSPLQDPQNNKFESKKLCDIVQESTEAAARNQSNLVNVVTRYLFQGFDKCPFQKGKHDIPSKMTATFYSTEDNVCNNVWRLLARLKPTYTTTNPDYYILVDFKITPNKVYACSDRQNYISGNGKINDNTNSNGLNNVGENGINNGEENENRNEDNDDSDQNNNGESNENGDDDSEKYMESNLYEAEIYLEGVDTYENEYFKLEERSIEYKYSLRSEDADFLQVDYSVLTLHREELIYSSELCDIVEESTAAAARNRSNLINVITKYLFRGFDKCPFQEGKYDIPPKITDTFYSSEGEHICHSVKRLLVKLKPTYNTDNPDHYILASFVIVPNRKYACAENPNENENEVENIAEESNVKNIGEGNGETTSNDDNVKEDEQINTVNTHEHDQEDNRDNDVNNNFFDNEGDNNREDIEDTDEEERNDENVVENDDQQNNDNRDNIEHNTAEEKEEEVNENGVTKDNNAEKNEENKEEVTEESPGGYEENHTDDVEDNGYNGENWEYDNENNGGSNGNDEGENKEENNYGFDENINNASMNDDADQSNKNYGTSVDERINENQAGNNDVINIRNNENGWINRASNGEENTNRCGWIALSFSNNCLVQSFIDRVKQIWTGTKNLFFNSSSSRSDYRSIEDSNQSNPSNKQTQEPQCGWTYLRGNCIWEYASFDRSKSSSNVDQYEATQCSWFSLTNNCVWPRS